jgi:hypothetical protein
MAVIHRPSGLSTATGPRILTAGPYLSSDTVIYVDSVTGSDSNTGLREELPKASVFGASGALSVCTTLQSHLVMCLKTHRETVASAYSTAKGNCTVASLGAGTDRATFTSAVAGIACDVAGIGMRWENVYFAASTAATTAWFRASAVGFELRDCWFDLGASDYTDSVLINAVANCVVRGTTFKCTATESTGTARIGVRVTGAATGCLIEGCTFDGSSYGWSSGYALRIESTTTDGYRIRGCTAQNRSVISVATGAKGYISDISTDATSRYEWTE